MSVHVKVIGWIYLVGSSLWAFGSLAGVGLSVFTALENGNDDAWLIAALFLGFLVLGAIGILVGRGLLKRRAWAWVGGLVVSALVLLLFPIGTILGVYGLVIFLQRETRPLFGYAGASTGPAAPPARTP